LIGFAVSFPSPVLDIRRCHPEQPFAGAEFIEHHTISPDVSAFADRLAPARSGAV